MRFTVILGVLCVVAAPTFASPVTYTFSVTVGGVTLNMEGVGSTSSGLAGSFAVAIGQSDGHVGADDTFTFDSANLQNTGTMQLGLTGGLATASLPPGKAKFLDFAHAGGVIPGNMVPVAAPMDVYVEATVFVTGLFTTTVSTKTWANSILPFQAAFSTSGRESDIQVAALFGTFRYELQIPDISYDSYIDLVVNLEGTSHVVPEPFLGGLATLGLGGAGAWLRRRK
jgi:MYXO-CTERM domain-containing protein